MSPASGLTRRDLLRAGGASIAGLSASAGCLSKGPSPAERVAEETDGLSAYADVGDALAAGYRSQPTYISTDAGALGVPFVNSEVTDLRADQPRALYYDLDESGEYVLLGAEWAVPVDDADEPPELFGKRFHDAREGAFPSQSRHYGLHAWLGRENPDGVFAEVHSAVEPPPYVDALNDAWDALGRYVSFRDGAEGAKADGYVNTEQWVETDQGAYGVPFVHPERRGTTLAEPATLLYRMTSSWYYELVGAEWLVPAEEYDAPPTIFGQPMHDASAGHGESGEQPRHYGLHAWLFRANPAGLFAPYNPALATEGQGTG